MGDSARIYLGTSAFTAAGWEGVFYPEGLKSADYLSYYATQFGSVEVDSTFYRIPSPAMVKRWYDVTPEGFLFAAKVPQVITHEKFLSDCGEEVKQFLGAMDELKEKLGPLVFQFPYFNRDRIAEPQDFFSKLRPFIRNLPRNYKFGVEVRNKNFLVPELMDSLRECGIALALIDHPWMPPVHELLQRCDPITADFTYIRWLGDRYEIEKITKSWVKTIVDRRRELSEWAKACRVILRRGVSIFAYANNHYAGHAPATVRTFEEIFGKIMGIQSGTTDQRRPAAPQKSSTPTLF
jgi:uncharacterized protein YecE (DUF72 family)